jgi:hypothetical protein
MRVMTGFSLVMAICKTVNIKPAKTRPKTPLKFLYGFLHKGSGHLEYSLIKLSALSPVLSGSFLKTFSLIMCYKSRFWQFLVLC